MIQNPIPWPNGAKCAVAITFDMDADSLIHIARPEDGFDRLYPVSMTAPRCGSSSRGTRLTSVVLPLPVGPMIANVCPEGT